MNISIDQASCDMKQLRFNYSAFNIELWVLLKKKHVKIISNNHRNDSIRHT